ncbi:unnamed protein product [Didymodactylos carnosus]|uniref:Uncharacterized protein n=1 Tax=Didymodactylos carnosus TaxID=1234261 RepID=A0A814CU98_9BILA|nr:unnamed protein product [Didymodactylos carnosus]CAF1530785.1 unnamed protein product [Didymodactylos carnosus]CAF3722101.1 unnamed protein product [Didymodactylos carnosus]CAF4317654.1 unnamed protein product [Didymodactylos carnosus]
MTEATTSIMNEKVESVQAVQRPMDSSSGSSAGSGSNVPGATHSGNLVTTEGGNQYLVHKGDGYSPSNPTVVTSADNMSSKWSSVGEASQPSSNQTVGGMMNNGEYSLTRGNCNDAAAANNPNVTTDTLSANIKPN